MSIILKIYIHGSAARPERDVILSNRAEPPALILASRRSRRMRACLWELVSSPEVCIWGLSIMAQGLITIR